MKTCYDHENKQIQHYIVLNLSSNPALIRYISSATHVGLKIGCTKLTKLVKDCVAESYLRFLVYPNFLVWHVSAKLHAFRQLISNPLLRIRI